MFNRFVLTGVLGAIALTSTDASACFRRRASCVYYQVYIVPMPCPEKPKSDGDKGDADKGDADKGDADKGDADKGGKSGDFRVLTYNAETKKLTLKGKDGKENPYTVNGETKIEVNEDGEKSPLSIEKIGDLKDKDVTVTVKGDVVTKIVYTKK